MTVKQEKELKAKGYRYEKTFDSKNEALEYAKRQRELGYYARVAEYSTNIKGYHDFGVWLKIKEM